MPDCISMATSTASPLLKHLLEPATMEHLVVGIDSVEFHRKRLPGLLATLNVYTSRLEQAGTHEAEIVERRLLEHPDRRSTESRVFLGTMLIDAVTQIGSYLKQTAI